MSRTRKPAALAVVASLALACGSVNAQVVPPSVLKSDAADAARATPMAQLTTTGAQRALDVFAPENRCAIGGATPSVSGSVGSMHDGRTVAFAGVVDPAGGRQIESFYGTEMAAAQRVVDIQGDPAGIRAEQTRLLALAMARTKQFKGPADAVDQLQKQEQGELLMQASMRAGKYLVIPSNGSYRCSGVSAGHHEVFVLVLHWEDLTHASPLGKSAMKMTLYSSLVDLPHPNSRAFIRADRLKLIGEIDPNGSPKHLKEIKAKPAT